MTVAAPLSPQVDRKRALAMGFLLSVPVSMAASLFLRGDRIRLGVRGGGSPRGGCGTDEFGWFVIAVGVVT